VLAAARQLLLEQGWEQVTVANVAQLSGYARSTLYRHWPNRLDLLRDAIAEQARLTHVTLTGSTRDDLVAELSAFVDAITTTGLGHMVAAMAHMARSDPEWAQLNEAVHLEGTSVLRQILVAAREEGAAIGGDDDGVSMLVGPLVHRFLFTSDPPDRMLVERTVDSFLGASGAASSGGS
jgi:AcrR family transcriptional regulator